METGRWKPASEWPLTDSIPDPFVMTDGTAITDPKDWGKRAEELRAMYSHYMYGVWRDGTDESLSYSYAPVDKTAAAAEPEEQDPMKRFFAPDADADGRVSITVKRVSTGAEVTFSASVRLPEESARGNGGCPVIIGMHPRISEEVAVEEGFATVTLDSFGLPIASDDTRHVGAFYELYPYGEQPSEQTGVLMAWAWGCSKVLDALLAGLAKELGIDASCAVVTGVSRWGKAAMVCGAFDRRFRVCAPSCSGAGGVAMYRYRSEGKTYDFSTKGVEGPYTYSQNEPLSCLQSDAERGWFCDEFCRFDAPERLPVDQHLLCSLTAEPDRYLFVIGSCTSEDWVNAPAMWFSYLGARRVFDFLGLSDHIAVNMHREGHAVIPEDVRLLAGFVRSRILGREAGCDLSGLDTSVFAIPANHDPLWDTYAEGWKLR